MYQEPEPPLDSPQEDEADVHAALINWARWCQEHWRQGHALSAEGNHRAEKGDTYDPPPPRRAIDILKAEAVNQGLLSVPGNHRTALLMRYYGIQRGRVTEWPSDAAIAKMIGINKSDYRRFMRDARLMLLAILQRNGMPL